MRSQLFRGYVALKPKFREDLSLLWDLSPDQRETILARIQAVFVADVERDRLTATESLVADLGGDAGKCLTAVSVLGFLHEQWDVAMDNAEQMMSDLLDLELIPETDEAVTFMRRFAALLETDARGRKGRAVAASVLRNLVRLDTVVDHRAVIEGEPYSWTDPKVEDYQPVVQELVAVAILRIVLSGEGEDAVFQCEEEDLQMLIRKLGATQKELEALKSTDAQ